MLNRNRRSIQFFIKRRSQKELNKLNLKPEEKVDDKLTDNVKKLIEKYDKLWLLNIVPINTIVK